MLEAAGLNFQRPLDDHKGGKNKGKKYIFTVECGLKYCQDMEVGGATSNHQWRRKERIKVKEATEARTEITVSERR